MAGRNKVFQKESDERMIRDMSGRQSIADALNSARQQGTGVGLAAPALPYATPTSRTQGIHSAPIPQQTPEQLRAQALERQQFVQEGGVLPTPDRQGIAPGVTQFNQLTPEPQGRADNPYSGANMPQAPQEEATKQWQMQK